MVNSNQDLQYFVGKLCTVFTAPMNRNFQAESPNTYPEAVYKYFMGVVESVGQTGLLLTQATNGLKTYFFINNIVAIAEEEVLDPDNPEHAEIIRQFDTPKPQPQVSIPSGPYVDPDALAELSKQLRDNLKPRDK